MIKNKKMRVLLKIFGVVAYVVTLYYLARLGLIGLNDTHKLRNIIPVFIVLFYLIPSQKTFFYIVLPFSLLACIVTPISLIYGDIDYQALISLIATNTIEAQEFIAQIPVKHFLQGISIPVLAFFAFWVSQKIDIKPWRNKVGVLIEVACESDFVAKNEDFKAFVKDLCMHIAAAAPICISKEDVPADIIAKEREIAMAQLEGDKKPEAIKEKIVNGKIDKFVSGVALLEQPFVKDDSMTIGDLIKSKIATIGEKIEVKRFTRYQI